MLRNEKSTRPNPVCRIIVRLCVIVCLWQGPVPWLHYHESELVELPTHPSPSSIVKLRQHMATFHDRVALDHDHEFGWHFHWILPGWSDGFHERPQDGEPANGFANLDSIIFFATVPALIDCLFDGDLCQRSRVRKFTDGRQPVRRIDRYQLPQRKHEFPLVMRC